MHVKRYVFGNEKFLNEVEKRAVLIVKALKSVKGLLISTIDGLPVISVGNFKEASKIASISAAFAQLSRLTGQILGEDKGYIEAKFNSMSIAIFPFKTAVFLAILDKDGNPDEIKKMIEKLFKE